MTEIRQSLRAPCKVGDIVQPIQAFCSGIGAAMERDPQHGWAVIEIVIGDRHNGDGPTELTVIEHEHNYGPRNSGMKRHYIDPCNIRVLRS